MSGHGFRRPDDVAMVDSDQQVNENAPFYLARLPHGPLVVLEGTASAIWRESLAGDEGDLVDRIAQRFGLPAEDICDDVRAFVADLLEQGLLERLDRPGT